MCLSEQVTAYVCVCLHMSLNGRLVGLGSIRSVIHGRDWPGQVEAIMSDVGRRSSDVVGCWKMEDEPCSDPGIQARQGTLDPTEGFGGVRLVAVVGRPLGVGELGVGSLALWVVRCVLG